MIRAYAVPSNTGRREPARPSRDDSARLLATGLGARAASFGALPCYPDEWSIRHARGTRFQRAAPLPLSSTRAIEASGDDNT